MAKSKTKVSKRLPYEAHADVVAEAEVVCEVLSPVDAFATLAAVQSGFIERMRPSERLAVVPIAANTIAALTED
jgi:hypothetical protein